MKEYILGDDFDIYYCQLWFVLLCIV